MRVRWGDNTFLFHLNKMNPTFDVRMKRQNWFFNFKLAHAPLNVKKMR